MDETGEYFGLLMGPLISIVVVVATSDVETRYGESHRPSVSLQKSKMTSCKRDS